MRPAILSTFASGFRRTYQSDEEEIRVCLGEAMADRGAGVRTGDPENHRQVWHPATIDFETQARRLPPAVGVANFRGLLDAIGQHQNLLEVHWFGHGSVGGGFLFGQGARFGPEELKQLNRTDLSACLSRVRGITFFACNVGQKDAFIQDLANALCVTVYAFRDPVKWSLGYDGAAPKRRITYRGVSGGALPLPTIVKWPVARAQPGQGATPQP